MASWTSSSPARLICIHSASSSGAQHLPPTAKKCLQQSDSAGPSCDMMKPEAPAKRGHGHARNEQETSKKRARNEQEASEKRARNERGAWERLRSFRHINSLRRYVRVNISTASRARITVDTGEPRDALRRSAQNSLRILMRERYLSAVYADSRPHAAHPFSAAASRRRLRLGRASRALRARRSRRRRGTPSESQRTSRGGGPPGALQVSRDSEVAGGRTRMGPIRVTAGVTRRRSGPAAGPSRIKRLGPESGPGPRLG